jgi:hypothetical protein
MRQSSSRRLSVEPLEGREVPAAVFTVMSGNTLFILGSSQSDSITLSQPIAGQLTIAPGAGTTINGSTNPVTGPLFGNLVIRLGAGDDSLAFDLTNGLRIPGSLVVDYGTAGIGTKTTTTVNAGQSMLSVGGGLGIRYAAGDVTTTLDNLAVAGSVAVRHATGDSQLTIDSLAGSGRFAMIGGSLTVVNTQGVADNTLSDTNVGGSVLFANGLARASDNAAGSTTIQNAANTSRAVIGGSLAISNLSGDSLTGDTVGDVIVRGSVALALGSGNFSATVASVNATGAPVSIGGNLAIRGTGAGPDTIVLGKAGTGLRVGMSLGVATGSGADSITINDLTVTGVTVIRTGLGDDTISIDGTASVGSAFVGAFAVNTGAGNDSVTINGGSATSTTTRFQSAVSVGLGADNDSLSLATAGKVRFNTPMMFPVSFSGGLGTNTKAETATNVSGHLPSLRNFT